ncbi:MAG: alkaline phosphatase family protein [Propionibacteriaceae bacterium]|nr:alkaline phosphatase family protein [Propionibacteriaceae bacterium]
MEQIGPSGRHHRRLTIGLLSAILMLGSLAAASDAFASPANPQSDLLITSTGLLPGQVKHVWLIILENKSYDATFTGLNQNSYLWQTLPSQGALLTNYYGTGHYSMDNYITLVSGQAPQQDTQSDCDKTNTNFGSNADILTSGPDKGQLNSPANVNQPSGANAPDGDNGCTYPDQVPTLFNQFDAAGVTWKGYAQDLYNQPGREDAMCGAPGTADNNPTTNPTVMTASAANPLPTGVTSFTGAQANDQYVAKHFPFAWFSSLSGATNPDGSTTSPLTTPAQGGYDCDPAHIANLDDATSGLWHDLQSESTTPAFSWITPNNCSDAHDAVCKGNNLSGAFRNGQPVYGSGTPDPESTTPANYTGGLYSADLFLKYYIPLIEQSPAFKDGGLIDITFDEANPPYSYSGNSFNNADAYAPTQAVLPNAATGILSDAAGQNINGTDVNYEPTGPNSTLDTDANGNQLYPGPGDNAFIDRPPECTQTSPTLVPANCVPGIVIAGGGTSPGVRNDQASGGPGSSILTDAKIVSTDAARIVTDTVDTTGPGGTSPIPADSFVGSVSNTGPLFPTDPTGAVTANSFQLVDQAGNPVTPTGDVTAITLSAQGAPGFLSAGMTPDPLYDAADATPGGGDTGSVLISPLITPGTVSSTYYNHYSWLRTMEDIFQVSQGTDTTALPAGTVSGGLDGLGHLGYAAQSGLTPFGPDVFTAAGNGQSPDTGSATSGTSGSTDNSGTAGTTVSPATSSGQGASADTGGTVAAYPPWMLVALVGFSAVLLTGALAAERVTRTRTRTVRR